MVRGEVMTTLGTNLREAVVEFRLGLEDRVWLNPRVIHVLIAFIAFCLLSASSFVHAQAATPGSFAINPVGAATYNIPILVPPGAAGMEPKLSFAYNSQGGNGSMGIGWSLQGLSMITRCGKTRASDGTQDGVFFNLNDRYCLDGQRLILVSGTYGVAGSVYRTETESYSRITAWGPQQGNGPSSFEVKTKSGLTIIYGGDPNGRMEVSDTDPTIALWAIKYVSDTKGNPLHYGYDKDTVRRELRPSFIPYAWASGKWNAWITITYEDRISDVMTAYRGHGKFIQAKRVQSVQTYTRLSPSHPDELAVMTRSYEIRYEASAPVTGRSRVSYIEECVPGACYPRTTMSWPGGSIARTPYSVPVYVTDNAQTGDFNNDGKTDLYSLAGAAASGEDPHWLTGTFCAGPLAGCTTISLKALINFKWVVRHED
jgi:Salmonella virulence plasmid 65kDa B protein